MGVVKNIVVRAIADFSGLISGSRRAGDAMGSLSDRMNRYTMGMSGALGGVAGKLAALAGIYIGLEGLRTSTADAIKFDAAMETLNNRMGASALSFNQWMDTTGKAMGYSKMNIAEYGNTFSNMLYDAAKDQEDLSNKTQKFLELSAIVRSKTGLAQEEVSKRMRSAMNMEADGADELGINVRATAVEQSKAFKQLSGGAAAFSDLNSGTQKAIMYTYILDEVTRRYGTTVSNNAATQTAIFSASLKDLGLHLGQAFLPVWTTVLPALTNLVNWLDRTAKQVGAFMRVMFGYSAMDTTKSAQDSTQAFKGQTAAVDGLTDAHKKLAKAKAGVAGFDQVNTLPDKDDKDKDAAAAAIGGTGTDKGKGGSSGASAVRNQPVMDDVDASIGAEGLANKFKAAVQDMKDTWQSFKDGIKQHSDIIISALVALGVVFLAFSLGFIVNAVTMSVSYVTAMIPVIATTLAAAAAFILANLPIILIIATIALLAFGITMLILHWKEVKEWTLKVWDAIWAKTKEVAGWIGDKFNDMVKAISDWGMALGVKAAQGYDAVCAAWNDAGKWFYDNVITPIVDFFVQLGIDIGTAASTAWTNVCNAFKAVGSWFYTNVITPIAAVWTKWSADVKTIADTAWTNICSAFLTAAQWFTDNVVIPVKTALGRVTEGIGNGLVTAFKSVYNTVAGYLNDLISMWNKITGSNKLTAGLSIGFQLPMLAKGGITNGPMAAIIGDNAGGREVVSPLNELTGHISTAVIQALAFSNTGGSKSNNDTRDIVLNIDGRQFARIVKPYMDDQNGSTTVMLNRI